MIETDDELFRIDQHYLGPPGRAFPRPVRYQAVGFGVVIGFVLYLVLFRIAGLPLTETWFLAAWGYATYWLTRRFLTYLGHERTVRSMFRSAVNDLTSPRPGNKATRKGERGHTVSVPEQLGRIRRVAGDRRADETGSSSDSTLRKATT